MNAILLSNKNLRAPEEKRRKLQSFGEATVSSSLNSGSSLRSDKGRKTTASSLDGNTESRSKNKKSGEEVSSLVKIREGSHEVTRVFELARNLLPEST